MESLKQITYLKPYPSKANFILCKVISDVLPDMQAPHLKAVLAEKYGILVRCFNKPGLQDHIRISIGKPEHTQALIDALQEIAL